MYGMYSLVYACGVTCDVLKTCKRFAPYMERKACTPCLVQVDFSTLAIASLDRVWGAKRRGTYSRGPDPPPR